jgi:hypothetical protein
MIGGLALVAVFVIARNPGHLQLDFLVGELLDRVQEIFGLHFPEPGDPFPESQNFHVAIFILFVFKTQIRKPVRHIHCSPRVLAVCRGAASSAGGNDAGIAPPACAEKTPQTAEID